MEDSAMQCVCWAAVAWVLGWGPRTVRAVRFSEWKGAATFSIVSGMLPQVVGVIMDDLL
jgi:hypothetical protein